MPTPDKAAHLVTNQDELAGCCALIAKQAELPLDTEFARTDTYRPKLCLVQIDTPQGVFCIDTLAGLDLGPLWSAISTTSSLKILHAAKQDMEVLLLVSGELPGPVFDTQIAAGLVGNPPQAGYATLVESEFGVRLDKSQTRTDWSRRPLSAAQLAYAADDVAWLPELAARLRQRLAELGRESWALEDSATLLDRSLYAVLPERAWERLSGIEYQPTEVQARARRLAAWREQRADQADRPRQWILADQVLLALASNAPPSMAALEALGLLAPAALRNSGEAILAALRAGEADVASGSIAPAQRSRPAPLDNGNLKRLSAVVQKIASDLGIAPEILATRSEMTALLRGERHLRLLRGWRRAVIGDALLNAL
jgi:ribonuclease D